MKREHVAKFLIDDPVGVADELVNLGGHVRDGAERPAEVHHHGALPTTVIRSGNAVQLPPIDLRPSFVHVGPG